MSPTLFASRNHENPNLTCQRYVRLNEIDYSKCPVFDAGTQAGTKLLELKRHMEAVSWEQSTLLENMDDVELNAQMKALTDEEESLKAQILDAQQTEVGLEEQATRHQQMWNNTMECSAGYTEFDDEFVRQIIQKITVEDAETIRIHFRDSDMVLGQEL